MTRKKHPIVYYAIHEESLRNGSFIRHSQYGYAQYINGDYMGRLDELPTEYAGQPLQRYDNDEARRFLPKDCHT